jgi:hypothetical protein
MHVSRVDQATAPGFRLGRRPGTPLDVLCPQETHGKATPRRVAFLIPDTRFRRNRT